jgi:hypothetical protein
MSSERVPQYRRHKPSGLAVVTLDARDFYLGPYGTAASRAEYDRLVGEWLANGRRLPSPGRPPAGLTVNELLAAYWPHVRHARPWGVGWLHSTREPLEQGRRPMA